MVSAARGQARKLRTVDYFPIDCLLRRQRSAVRLVPNKTKSSHLNSNLFHRGRQPHLCLTSRRYARCFTIAKFSPTLRCCSRSCLNPRHERPLLARESIATLTKLAVHIASGTLNVATVFCSDIPRCVVAPKWRSILPRGVGPSRVKS